MAGLSGVLIGLYIIAFEHSQFEYYVKYEPMVWSP